MATVRFSDKLKEDVVRNAKKIFNKELTDARADTPANWTGEYIYNTVFSKATRDTMNALPAKFMEETKLLNFGGFRQVPEGESRDYWGLSSDLQFTATIPLRMPHGSDHDTFHKSWRGLTLVYGVPEFATLQAEFKQWRDKQWAVVAKQAKFVAGVKQIMDTYSTLSPALKVFPALWDLIPEEYRERHLKIVNRKRGDTKELGDLDVNSLTAAVTLNKLTR
jgi:hypothetical protein